MRCLIMNGSNGRSPRMCVRSWMMSHITNVRSASSWSSSRAAASSGSSSFVISDAARTTRRYRAASRSWKIAPHVNGGISRIATVSGNSTAEFVS